MQKGIIALIRSGLSGERMPLPANFSIEEIYPTLLHHQITALCYEGAVICGISKNSPTMNKLFQYNYKNLIKSEGQDREIANILSVFEENKINYLPLKGYVLKDLYPRRELRQMGDADILIKEKQYKTIKPLVISQGFKEKVGSDHAYIWYKKELTLELHKRPAPADILEFYDYFGDGWSKALHKSGCCYALSPEDEYIYIFSHFAKHFYLGGVGYRQAIDIWLFKKNYPQLNWNYIEEEIKKLKLFEFYKNVISTLQVWFEDAESNEITNLISDFIFNSGSWGNDENKAISKTARHEGKDDSLVKVKFSRKIGLIFPTKTAIEGRYRILEKAPFLLPFIWVYRWIDILRNRPKNITLRLNEVNSVNENNLTEYRENMRRLGL